MAHEPSWSLECWSKAGPASTCRSFALRAACRGERQWPQGLPLRAQPGPSLPWSRPGGCGRPSDLGPSFLLRGSRPSQDRRCHCPRFVLRGASICSLQRPAGVASLGPSSPASQVRRCCRVASGTEGLSDLSRSAQQSQADLLWGQGCSQPLPAASSLCRVPSCWAQALLG